MWSFIKTNALTCLALSIIVLAISIIKLQNHIEEMEKRLSVISQNTILPAPAK